jgi:hypothetical protein
MFRLEKTTDLHKVCFAVADRIYSFLNDHIEKLPPLERIDFNQIPSAFHAESPAPGAFRPIDPTKREIRVFCLAPTRQEWSTAVQRQALDLGGSRDSARPFADAPGVTVRHATEEGIGKVRADLPVAHEEVPADIVAALDATKDTLTTPLVVFDRRAIKIPILRKAADGYVSHNFENTGFVTVAGGEITDDEIDLICAAKKGAMPALHNWIVPQGRKQYVESVATITAELEAQLVKTRLAQSPISGDTIPGLRGPTG